MKPAWKLLGGLMSLPINPKRAYLDLSSVNTQLGNAPNTPISLNQVTVRNLALVSTGVISFEDLFGKPGNEAVGGWSAVVTSTSTSIMVEITGLGTTIYPKYASFYLLDYTNNVIGTVLQQEEFSSGISKTFYGLTPGNDYFVVAAITGYDGSTYAYKAVKAGIITIPGTPSLSVTSNNNSITATITPITSPSSGLPTIEYAALYLYMDTFTLITNESRYSSEPWTHIYQNLPENRRYYFYGSVGNSAGSASDSRIIWTTSPSILSTPGQSVIIPDGTSNSRRFWWTPGQNAAIYDILVYDYTGSVLGDSICELRNITVTEATFTTIPAGKAIYVILFAYNYLGFTYTSIVLTN
jgi:hypothetical protein